MSYFFKGDTFIYQRPNGEILKGLMSCSELFSRSMYSLNVDNSHNEFEHDIYRVIIGKKNFDLIIRIFQENKVCLGRIVLTEKAINKDLWE